MKYLSQLKIVFLSFLLLPIMASAVRPAFVAPNFKKTWLLDIHLLQLRNENILNEDNEFDFIRSNFATLNSIPKGVNRIHMYGNGRTKNTTVVVFGDISRNELEKEILKRVFGNNSENELVEKKDLPSGTQVITKLVIRNSSNNKTRELYYADVTQGIWSVSYNITELRRWMDYPYGYLNFKRGEKVSKLVSLWVDVKPTLKNLKKDNEEDSYIIKSNILKQTKSFSATIQRSGEYLYFGTKLTAINVKEINKLFELIDTSILKKSESSDSLIISTLSKNIKKQKTKKSVTVSSQVLKSIFINN